MSYPPRTRRAYLEMIDRIGRHWLTIFEGDQEFYSTAYWDLLTTLWRSGGAMRKTDALAAMTAVKSPHTAGKYLDAAIRRGLVREEHNPADARSKLVRLSPEMARRMDTFFDKAVDEVKLTATAIRDTQEDTSPPEAAGIPKAAP